MLYRPCLLAHDSPHRPRATRRLLVAWLVVFSCGMLLASEARAQTRLIAAEEAALLGLKRAWFAQIRVNPTRGRVQRIVPHGDSVFALTQRGVVQALDASTGRVRWTASLGNPDYPSAGPAVSDDHVALLNGTMLYLLDRGTGAVLWEVSVRGAPGAAPALSPSYVFVPMINGVMEGYPVDFAEQDIRRPWKYTSAGGIFVAPTATRDSVAWPTARGFLYVSRGQDPGVRFRLESGGEINVPAAAVSPHFFTVTDDGFVYAVHEINGARRWQVSIGDPVLEPIAAIRNRLFVCSTAPHMHCLDTDKGETVWKAREIQRFVAASPDFVYGMGRLGDLRVLDAASGDEVGRLKPRGATLPVINLSSDRIFLASPTGLIQCLHEVDRPDPIYYLQEQAAEEDPDAPEEPFAADEDPFAGD